MEGDKPLFLVQQILLRRYVFHSRQAVVTLMVEEQALVTSVLITGL